MSKTNRSVRQECIVTTTFITGIITALIIFLLPSYAWANEKSSVSSLPETTLNSLSVAGNDAIQNEANTDVENPVEGRNTNKSTPEENGSVNDLIIDTSTDKEINTTSDALSDNSPAASKSDLDAIEGRNNTITETTAETTNTSIDKLTTPVALKTPTTPRGSGRPFLQVGNAVLFDGEKQDASTTGAFYTKSLNRLVLNSAITGAIIARYLGDNFTVFAHDGTVLITPNEDDNSPLLHVIGAVVFDGKENNIVAILGNVNIEKAGTGTIADGSLTLNNVNLQVTALNTDSSIPLMNIEGNANINSGALGITSIQNEVALNVDGKLTISGGGNLPKQKVPISLFGKKMNLEIDGKHAITNISGNGAVVGSDLRVANSNFDVFALGGTGVSTKGSVYLNRANVSIQSILDKQSGSSSSATYGLSINASKSAPAMLTVKDSVLEVTGIGFNSKDAAIFGASAGMLIDGGYVTANAPLSAGIAMLDDTVLLQSGTLDAIGAYVGIATKTLVVNGGALNAFALGSLDLSDYDIKQLQELIKQAEESAKSGDYSKYLAAIAQLRYLALNNMKGYAITADNIHIKGGTVTALALCNTALFGKSSGNEFIAINASNSVLIEGGTVVALANAANQKSAAIGIHSGMPGTGPDAKRGSIVITGGTVSAYAFQSAQHRLAMYAEPANGLPGTVNIDKRMNVAAGDMAPGKRVEAGSLGPSPLYTYLYLSTGKLYLTDEYLTWDSLGKELACYLMGFDPPNNQLKVTREMMQTFVGLNRPVMILSNNVDLISGTWLESYMTAYLRTKMIDPDGNNVIMSGMFKGTGVVFLLETGSMFGKTTIHQVEGIEIYDFNTRYDTNPERNIMANLVGDRLIHSIHFAYQPGPWPADMTLFMSVGSKYAGQTVWWHYLDPLTGQLMLQWFGVVDPFGWIEVSNQKALPARETAICLQQQQAMTLPTTGDYVSQRFIESLLIMAVFSILFIINAVVLLKKEKGCYHHV